MNSQNKLPEYAKKLLLRNGIDAYDADYYAWPEVFGSTSGPRGGIVVQAVTSFTVDAYVSTDTGHSLLICAGMYHFSTERFEPFMRVKQWAKIPSEILP